VARSKRTSREVSEVKSAKELKVSLLVEPPRERWVNSFVTAQETKRNDLAMRDHPKTMQKETKRPSRSLPSRSDEEFDVKCKERREGNATSFCTMPTDPLSRRPSFTERRDEHVPSACNKKDPYGQPITSRFFPKTSTSCSVEACLVMRSARSLA